MQITIQTDYVGDLTSDQITTIDSALRNQITSLVSWAFQVGTGQLTLDLGDVNESDFQTWIDTICDTIGSFTDIVNSSSPTLSARLSLNTNSLVQQVLSYKITSVTS